MNPGNILGRYDVTGWARFFLLIQQRKLPGVPPAGGTFCDVESVARGHITAAERGERGANYLLGGADGTYLEMVRIMGKLTNKPVPQRTVPMFGTSHAQLIACRRPDARKIAFASESRDASWIASGRWRRRVHVAMSRVKKSS